MFDPISMGAMAIGAGTSAMGARQQNQAIRSSMQSQTQATAAHQRQLSEQAQIERQKALNQAQQVRGRLRVAAGEAGTGAGGTFHALMRQADFDQAVNTNIINRNLANNLARVSSQHQAQMAGLSASMQNPLLSAFTGGLQGMQTGLAIGQSAEQFHRIQPAPTPRLAVDGPGIPNELHARNRPEF